MLEAAAPAEGSSLELTSESVEKAVAHALPRYDRDGDQHYDVTSAPSRASVAAMWTPRCTTWPGMVVAGEDPRFIARRLVILASEDIGMADPTALQTAVAAMHTVSFCWSS